MMGGIALAGSEAEDLPLLEPADPIAEHRFAKMARRGCLISVVYPYYCKRDVLLRSIEHLRSQAKDLDKETVEIIVVDDGSPEDGVENLLPEDVHYLWQRRNGFGASRARNTGARLANGRYLLFLDPDILVEDGYIGAVLAGFCTHGDRAVLCGYTDSYYFESSPDPRVQFGVWEAPDRPTRRFFQLAAGNVALSRSLFWESGGFDEDLIYGELEDTVLGYKIGTRPGASIVFSSGMRARHVPHPPGPAHADGARTMAIIRRKWPDFYHDFVERSVR